MLARPLAACLLVVVAGAATARFAPVSLSDRAEAAGAFLAALDEGQRAEAAFAFTDDERRNWQMAPFGEAGVRYENLSQAQRDKAWALLATVLSEDGVEKVRGVMTLEGILVALETERGRRSALHGAERYFFSVYGDPTAGEPWGFRVEGHHLSLSFTEIDGELVTHAPGFFGSQPATVASGKHKGFQLLGEEDALARTLLESLTDEQRERGHLDGQVPGNSVLTPGNDAGFEAARGLPVSAMNKEQRAHLHAVIERYLANMQPAIAERERGRLAASILTGDIHFLWLGSTVADEGHYWHIHAPHFAIEYCAPVRDPQHVHSSWRDFEDDFGAASLKRRADKR